MASTEGAHDGRLRVVHVMVAVAAFAAFFAMARETGWFAAVLLIPAGFALALGLSHGLPARDKAQRAGLRYASLAIVLNTVVFFQGLATHGAVGLIVTLQTALLVAGVVCVAYSTWLTKLGERGGRPALSWLRLLSVAVAVVMPFVCLLTLLPLRVGVLVSGPALHQLADEVATGRASRWPQRAGMFQVLRGEVDATSGNVGLVLDDDPNGRTGLVRVAPGATSTVRPFLNLNLDIDLGGGWRFQQED